MWIIIIVLILLALYLFFYVKGKQHEKEMKVENFANEMIVDTVAKYPKDVNVAILEKDDDSDKVKTCEWCKGAGDLNEELIWNNTRLRDDDERKQCNDFSQDDMDDYDDENKCKKKKKKCTCEDNDDSHEDRSGHINYHYYDELKKCKKKNEKYEKDKEEEEREKEEQMAEEATKSKENKYAVIDDEEYMKLVRKMKKQSLSEEELKNMRSWFIEPDPQILSPYGFVYMPNTLWSVPQKRPPVCITDSKCAVQPTFSSSKFADVYEYTGVGTIMPNFEYKEKPTSSHPDKEKYLQKVSEKKKFNPHYFYPGWYGYDEKDTSDVNSDL